MAALLLTICFALICEPASSQTTRAIFVGIDAYRHSKTTDRNASFSDLRGAVADTVRFKNLLREVYKLELDRTPQGICPTEPHPVSVTLLNGCATRAEILKALEEMIARSAPKDTLIFYFAGHGSQYADDSDFDQSSGYNGTILPTDARDPAAIAEGDIIDKELRAIKERAVAKGVYFVSIFDSCNSGTATRNGALGQSRNVPPLTAKPPVRAASPEPAGPGGGYWVHLAAAQDGEQAQEVGAVGKREGVFTTALIETMRAMPFGTFGDIMREVQAKIAARGHVSQNPMAEGALKASLGAASGQGITYDAEISGNRIAMKAGALSGVTTGSVFALYSSQADALLAGSNALAKARVSKVSDYAAELELLADPATALPPRLVAIETQHAFGDVRLEVANRMELPAEKKAVDRALVATKMANTGNASQVQIAPVAGKAGFAQLLTSDGTPIGELGALEDSAFVERLTGKLKKVRRVQQLLALRTAPKTAGLAFCIDDSDYPATAGACPPPEQRNMRVLGKGSQALVTVENQAGEPRYLYVLGIDPAFGVALILPPPGAVDSKVAPLRPHRVPDDPLVLTSPGLYRFVTLATEQPINAAAFEQDGTKARGGAACRSALEKLLCDANRGTRDPAAPQVGDWSAVVDTVLVK